MFFTQDVWLFYYTRPQHVLQSSPLSGQTPPLALSLGRGKWQKPPQPPPTRRTQEKSSSANTHSIAACPHPTLFPPIPSQHSTYHLNSSNSAVVQSRRASVLQRVNCAGVLQHVATHFDKIAEQSQWIATHCNTTAEHSCACAQCCYQTTARFEFRFRNPLLQPLSQYIESPPMCRRERILVLCHPTPAPLVHLGVILHFS